MPIYAGPSYAMGALEVAQAAGSPITSSQAQRAKAELARMRKALRKWLQYRSINDQVATGNGHRVPDALLKMPGASAAPAAVVKVRLDRQRRPEEEALALHLHQLLSEVFDGGSLPSPDLAKNPAAAVQLAEIAIAGKLPGELPKPTAVGFIWLWPAVIVVGGIALVLTTMIRSNAETAMERERFECIKSGKCTDTGFWLKAGAVVGIGWILWDKAGVGQRVTGLFGRRKKR